MITLKDMWEGHKKSSIPDGALDALVRRSMVDFVQGVVAALNLIANETEDSLGVSIETLTKDIVEFRDRVAKEGRVEL